MTLSKPILFVVLITALTSMTLYAKEAPATTPPLDQAYLDHWFYYYSAEPANVALGPLDDDDLGERAELNFTSDDGQAVNGLIGFPKGKGASRKLALALHPMGIDQQFWWSEKSPLAAQNMTARLRQQGYTVISLDARRHGKRGSDTFGPR
jgi:hypothetical protein